MKILKSIYIIICIILFSSCVHFRYKLRAENSFNGIDKSINKDNTFYTIVIHGTGYKPLNYSYRMIDFIAKDLNFLDSEPKIDNLIKEDITNNPVKKFTYQSNDKTAVFYSIRWSHLTEKYKKNIHLVENEKNKFRNLIAKNVKHKVIIDEFTDFILSQNEEIKDSLNSYFDAIFSDIEQINKQIINKNEQKEDFNLNVISASLGSFIVLNYLYELKEKENKIKTGPQKNDLIDIDFISNEEKFNLNLFMLTNQINFLIPLISGENQKDNSFSKAYNSTEEYIKELNVVAFRNQNDPLCFYLDDSDSIMSKYGNAIDTKTTNVQYYNFILRNRLDKAHTLPFDLKKIYSAIAIGSKSKWVKVIKE